MNVQDKKENDCIKGKMEIIALFNEKIKNKQINISKCNVKHCGKEGHWLEKQMNIKHNSKNEPDINGYEMKKSSKKITFGDFSASEYLFSKDKPNIKSKNKWNNDISISRTEFIKYFGTQKPLKNNRYSWSGSCIPHYNKWNECGQNLLIDNDNNIIIYYSFSKDNRPVKNNFPDFLKNDNIVIVFWKNIKMEQHINKKFNKNGFFIIKKNKNLYDKICFGNKFNYLNFINGIKSKNIIFDSGMVNGNNRNYSHFRSVNNDFWNNLITEEY